jgi:CysZ protein
MIAAALAAAEQIFTRPFRTVFWKSLGLTLLLLALLWGGIEKLVVLYVHLPYAWLATLVHVVAGFGLVVGVAFLVTPVSFIVAGFFFDELADHAEDAVAGPGGRGRAMAIGPALWIGLKFAALSLLVNAMALVLLLVPGVNAVAFFGANAYLLGRGYFELAALRYRPLADVRALRQRHGLRIILAGAIVAGLLAVPILNLLTPLFASAFLVRVAHPIVARRLEPQAIR